MQVAPYGSWRSPIQAEHIAAETLKLSGVQVVEPHVYWAEGRPAEGGRVVVMRYGPEGFQECLPAGFNARSRVHEYGGGAWVVGGGALFFSNHPDGRLYRCPLPGGAVPPKTSPLTPEGFRYADLVWDPARKRLLAVREDHTGEGEPLNTIVAVDEEKGGPGAVLAKGADFYAAPRLSPDGRSLAYIRWSHPNMPWDETELWTASLDAAGRVSGERKAVGEKRESVLMPEWSPSGVLHFASDRSGWWNLYRLEDGRAVWLTDADADFAPPHWVFGERSYDFLDSERILCAFTQLGLWSLGELDCATRTLKPFESPYRDIRYLRVGAGKVYFIAGTPAAPTAVVYTDLRLGRTEAVRLATQRNVAAGYLSKPEPVDFPVPGGRAFGLFYRPANRHFSAPEGDKPPLVVKAHSGPTTAASASMRLDIQYYTSRGIAVLDVNYGGSTGFGRPFRERLYGRWGEADVDDCCAGARFLAERGDVDGKRMAVTGSSAGGYTALACLAFRDVFACAASHYGISDLETLAQDTHKFEAHYMDQLVGPYPARKDLYRERSPLHRIDRMKRPVIFFQGVEDKVVPPQQSERLHETLAKRGVPTAYLPFEGEGHGFRRAETIRRALEAELYFFSSVLGFRLAEPVEPIEIRNLKQLGPSPSA